MDTLARALRDELPAASPVTYGHLQFERWSAAHPRWAEGFCFVQDTYKAQGLPMTPARDARVVRICALEVTTGALLGTIGVRSAGFS